MYIYNTITFAAKTVKLKRALSHLSLSVLLPLVRSPSHLSTSVVLELDSFINFAQVFVSFYFGKCFPVTGQTFWLKCNWSDLRPCGFHSSSRFLVKCVRCSGILNYLFPPGLSLIHAQDQTRTGYREIEVIQTGRGTVNDISQFLI